MRITVARVPRPNVVQTVDVPEASTAGEVVRLVGAHPDQVVVIRGETPLPLDAPICEHDVLRIVNVFSGG